MIYIREYPSQARLKELFDYIDGHLVWRSRPRSEFKKNNSYVSFNRHLAGKVALTGKINGYWVTKINGSSYRTHRLIWIWNNGDLRQDQEVDHIDEDILNYSLSNLRVSLRRQNCLNRGAQSNNKIGIKGICWDKSRNKWMAYVRSGDNQVKKRFVELEDAVEFVRKAREELHGEFHNHGD